MPYTADRPAPRETADQLRARIPGWGVDADPADRPAVPRERFDPGATGAHWDFPERQPEVRPRERSIEHLQLPPVFGTTAPLKGASGAVRRLAYARYSEARAAHWLLLIAADRIDVAESRVTGLLGGHPDHLIAETGARSEVTHHGWRSRVRRGRADLPHQLLDPVVVTGPALIAGGLAYLAVKARGHRRAEATAGERRVARTVRPA